MPLASYPIQPPTKPQSLQELPRRPSRLTSWFFVILTIALAAGMFWVRSQRPQPVSPAEAQTLICSVQTWDNFLTAADSSTPLRSALVPHLHDQPQLESPPGVHWLHLAAFWLSRSPQTTDQLVGVARLTSACLSLLTLVAIFWAGRSLVDTRTGHYATLACFSAILFPYFALQATPSAPLACWVMLSIATALWAIRPFRPPTYLFRQALGWTLCGLTLALALLTAGPPALLYAILPIFLLLLLCPNRLSHFLGLVAALTIATLVVLPWVIRVQTQTPGAWTLWLHELTPQPMTSPRQLAGPAARLATATLPWTLLFAGALASLFVARDVARTRLFVGCIWLVVTASALLFLSANQHPEHLAVLALVTGVVIGQLAGFYHDCVSEGRKPPLWKALSWTHWTCALIVSLLITAMPLFGQRLWAWVPADLGDLLDSPGGDWIYWLPFGGILLLLCALALLWMTRDRPGRAFVNLSLWAVVAMFALLAAPEHGRDPGPHIRSEADQVTKRVQDQPIYQLEDQSAQPASIDPRLFLYVRRPAPRLSSTEIAQALERDRSQDFYLITPAASPDVSSMNPSAPAQRVLDLPESGAVLWRFPPPSHTLR